MRMLTLTLTLTLTLSFITPLGGFCDQLPTQYDFALPLETPEADPTTLRPLNHRHGASEPSLWFMATALAAQPEPFHMHSWW